MGSVRNHPLVGEHCGDAASFLQNQANSGIHKHSIFALGEFCNVAECQFLCLELEKLSKSNCII